MEKRWRAVLFCLCCWMRYATAQQPQQQQNSNNNNTSATPDSKQIIPTPTIYTSNTLENTTINNNNNNLNNNNNNNNNGNIHNSIEDTTNLEMDIDNVKSFIMEKYGRHYRLTGDSSFKSTASDATVGKKKDRIPVKTEGRSKADESSRELENGISDVKSIIMEKYGRHYRLTGGSTLATKRDKGEFLIIDVSNASRGSNDSSTTSSAASGKYAANVTSHSIDSTSDKMSLLHQNTTVENTTVVARNVTVAAENATVVVKNTTPAVTHMTTAVKNTTSGPKYNTSSDSSSLLSNSTVLPHTTNNTDYITTSSLSDTGGNKTTSSKSDVSNTTTTATSKSDIQNATMVKPQGGGGGPQNNTVINLPITKDKTSEDGATQEIIFGTPPQTGNSEQNITEEGNLTTITIDLTKGNTSAVIPGLDILRSPVQSVDVIVTDPKDQEHAPKRSGPSPQGGAKHNKHIVFQMTKPRIAINDFANKRRHVPHGHDVTYVHGGKNHVHGEKNHAHAKKNHVVGGKNHVHGLGNHVDKGRHHVHLQGQK